MTRNLQSFLIPLCVSLLAPGASSFAADKVPGEAKAANTSSAAGAEAARVAAQADLQDAEGKNIGTVTLTQTKEGVRFVGKFSDLKPGSHGIHVHEKAKCEGPSFESAGGHFNPARKKHGLANPKGPHSGDFPNIEVSAGGAAAFDFVNPRVSLQGKHGLLEGGGTALVVHADPDDGKSDPAGNSGARVACGVIRRLGETQLK